MFNFVTVNGSKTHACRVSFYTKSSNISHIFLVLRAYMVSALTTIQHLVGHFQSLEVNPTTTFLDQCYMKSDDKKLPLNNLRSKRICIFSIPIRSLQKCMGTVYVSSPIRAKIY